jgi:hypothetical protein
MFMISAPGNRFTRSSFLNLFSSLETSSGENPSTLGIVWELPILIGSIGFTGGNNNN